MCDQTEEDQGFDEFQDCWNCFGTGFSHHDCGDDTCCCLEPEDNVVCDICNGKGGWPYDFSSDEA